ncbi:hypothetical protein GCM10023353_00040 [Tomitella cavernea]|uniref:Small ribosomal subunit protein bS6 n=1 Tax=Tomitella cavernea TaxID=1387982 RepID=A0ABP9C1B7_9ACTN
MRSRASVRNDDHPRAESGRAHRYPVHGDAAERRPWYGGKVDNLDVWGKRRLAYEIDKKTEGIYVVVDMTAESATVKEFDRQLGLNESVLRTKVLRRSA